MFKINGITNFELGVIAVEEDFFTRAAIRYEEIQIDGRNESIFQELGYANLARQMELQVIDLSKLDFIYQVLTGVCTLEYNDRITHIRIYDELDTTRLSSLKKVVVKYIRDPFWYKADDPFIDITEHVINDGNVACAPLIELTGDGKIDITVANTRFIYTFDADKKVLIDCYEKSESYNDISKSKNIEIGFDYPILAPGSNLVKVHSGNPTIRIKRKDAWL